MRVLSVQTMCIPQLAALSADLTMIITILTKIRIRRIPAIARQTGNTTAVIITITMDAAHLPSR
jgi:hypothetical protein